MTARYLLDTNVLSEPVRPRPDAGLLARLERHADELATASVVWHELLFGLAKLRPSRKRRAIEGYLAGIVDSSMPILAYDEESAAWHARERGRLERIGRPTPFRDGQIAAVARTRGLTLVTRNGRDFRAFSGLEVVDWFSGP